MGLLSFAAYDVISDDDFLRLQSHKENCSCFCVCVFSLASWWVVWVLFSLFLILGMYTFELSFIYKNLFPLTENVQSVWK